MKSYFVSLTRDLIGVYIEYRADSRSAVVAYLQHRYLSNERVWKLPWCAVYEELPTDVGTPIVIQAKCGPIYKEDYEQ